MFQCRLQRGIDLVNCACVRVICEHEQDGNARDGCCRVERVNRRRVIIASATSVVDVRQSCVELGEGIPEPGVVDRSRDIQAGHDDRNLGECANRDAGDDAKRPSTSASQRPEQVRVLVGIGCDQCSLETQKSVTSISDSHWDQLTFAVTTSNSKALSDARPPHTPKGECPPP